MDAITLLKDDHKSVERLFKRFEKAGDRAYVEKRDIVDRIIEELAGHAAIEEQLFYPVVRATVPETDTVALESLEEHHLVKIVLAELQKMEPEDERFDAKVTVLIENVRHHVEEEEGELFPKVRDELGRGALADLGGAMEEARKLAPTRAHPLAPDTPPGNLVVGAAAGVADRISDTVSGIAQGSVSAVNDLIATVMRRKKPRSSPSGSRATRKTAEQVREGAADATEKAIEITRSAQRGATSTARSAKSGSKRTASTAKSSAKRTASTARSSAKRTASTAKSSAKRTASTAKSSAKRTASTPQRRAS